MRSHLHQREKDKGLETDDADDNMIKSNKGEKIRAFEYRQSGRCLFVFLTIFLIHENSRGRARFIE